MSKQRLCGVKLWSFQRNDTSELFAVCTLCYIFLCFLFPVLLLQLLFCCCWIKSIERVWSSPRDVQLKHAVCWLLIKSLSVTFPSVLEKGKILQHKQKSRNVVQNQFESKMSHTTLTALKNIATRFISFYIKVEFLLDSQHCKLLLHRACRVGGQCTLNSFNSKCKLKLPR